MTPFDRSSAENLPPVVIGSPRRSDAAVLWSAVAETGLPVKEFVPHSDLAGDLGPIGCLVLAQEALSGALLQEIGEVLQRQPVWSELPIIIIAEATMNATARDSVRERWHPAKTLFQNRPVGADEFRGAVQFAIASRLRQFQIRDQIAQEEELRRELNHRVKNILATVQSIASMTRRLSSSQEDAFDRFTARLEALGNVHSTLHGMADQGATFEHIVNEVFRPYHGHVSMVEVSGTPRLLQPQSATLLGLSLYELLTNAVKYGALSVPSGRVRTALTQTDTSAELTWTERGGPPAVAPSRSGYGSRFISLTLGTLFGEPPRITYDNAGLSLAVKGPAGELFAQLPR